MKKTAKRTLTITRKNWLRGEGSANSYLYRQEDGKQCCLGFYARDCGIRQKDICDVTTPEEINSNYVHIPKRFDWLLSDIEGDPSFDTIELMKLNDDEDTSTRAKEWNIKKIFAKHDVIVKFV